MPWFAAHAILYFQVKEGVQDSYLVHENVLLIEAETSDQAWVVAADLARQEEGDDSGTLRIGGRPARRMFGGIRKIVSVLHRGMEAQPGNGDEITYSEFSLTDRSALDRLIEGVDVDVRYGGDDTASSNQSGQSERPKEVDR